MKTSFCETDRTSSEILFELIIVFVKFHCDDSRNKFFSLSSLFIPKPVTFLYRKVKSYSTPKRILQSENHACTIVFPISGKHSAWLKTSPTANVNKDYSVHRRGY